MILWWFHCIWSSAFVVEWAALAGLPACEGKGAANWPVEVGPIQLSAASSTVAAVAAIRVSPPEPAGRLKVSRPIIGQRAHCYLLLGEPASQQIRSKFKCKFMLIIDRP